MTFLLSCLTVVLLATAGSPTEIRLQKVPFEALKHIEVASQYEGDRIVVTGFLYKVEGTWTLASEPNLKSCCLGTSSKRLSQINVEGDFSGVMDRSSTAVAISGVWHIEDSGDVVRYQMTKASIYAEPSRLPLLTLAIIIATGAAATSVILYRRRRLNKC